MGDVSHGWPWQHPDRYAAAPIVLASRILPPPTVVKSSASIGQALIANRWDLLPSSANFILGSGAVHKDGVSGSAVREVAAGRLPGSNRIA
jgi:hypothetical protein